MIRLGHSVLVVMKTIMKIILLFRQQEDSPDGSTAALVSSAAAKAALENLSSLHRTIEIENPLDNPEVETVYREWFGGRYAHYYNVDL